MEPSGDESDGLNDPYFDMAECKIAYAPDIKWEDLSPILQTEIVRNLSHIYTSSHIAALLELDINEQKIILEHSSLRKAQWEEENRKLYQMRDKQLRALLRIDNSVLKRSRVPGQLVFRNVSKHYIRNPLARADPDYFMIKASDLLAARRYLRRKGINPRFAGEWENDMAAIQRPAKDYEDEDLRWTLDSDDVNEQDTPTQTDTESSLPDSTPPTSPQKSKSTPVSPQVQFINHFGGPNGTACEVPMYPKPDKDPSTPLNAAQHILLGRRKLYPRPERHSTVSAKPSNADDSIIRLSVGPEGAAQIQNSPKSTLPSPAPIATHDSHATPPLPAKLDMARDSPTQGGMSHTQVIGRKRRYSASPTRETNPYSLDESTEMPLEKVLGTKLWYKSGVMDSLSWRTNDSPKNFTEKLRAVRDEKRTKTRTAAVGSLEADGMLILDHALPIHSSPKTQGSTDLAAFGIGTQVQLPALPPTAVDTSVNEQSHSQNVSDTPMADSAYYSLPNITVGDEGEHGPPYSPISSRSVSEPNTERGKTPVEQDGDAEPTGIETVPPAGDGGDPNLEGGIDAEERYYTPEEPGEAILTTKVPKGQGLEHESSALVENKHKAEHESIERHDVGGPVRLNSEANYEPTLESPADTPKTLEHNDKDDSYDSTSVDAGDQVHQPDGSPLSSWDLVGDDTKSVSATPEEGQPKKIGRNSRIRQSTPRRSERINPTPGRTLRSRSAKASGTK